MKNAAAVVLFFIFLNACSTDFETIAPWKETMVIYGLLNPNDAVQYVRISKAYLGEGNALKMAEEADSIYYRDSLIVTMERWQSNLVQESQVLQLCDPNEVPKDTGIFAAPYQAVYKYTLSMHPGNAEDNSIYKIIVTNRTTGNVVTASTKIIENFNIISPNSVSAYKFNTISQTWKMTSSRKGKIYGILQKIKYAEVNTVTNDTVHKSIDWNLGDKTSISNAQAELTFPFACRDLYRLLGDACDPDPNITRFLEATPVDVYVGAGTEEMYAYIQVTNPNSGIVQDRPLYTNVTNGIGFFSCRTTRKIGIHLHPDTYAALDTSFYTRDLNFIH